MRILITGGTGFIGRHLARLLLAQGHRVDALGSRADQQAIDHPRFTYIPADTTRPGPWQAALQTVDGVVNLAGRSIFKRWSRAQKQKIYDSRILTTRHLVAALPDHRPPFVCSASAVGYYGPCGDQLLSEDAPCGDDFLARLARDWESEALRARERGARVALMRFGIVLGPRGGAMGPMIPAFRWFLGGPLGPGRQWFPWIHLDDLVAAVVFILGARNIQGPVNFCAPGQIRQRDFAAALGRALKRPAVMPAPAFLLRLVLGEFAGVLLSGQRVRPDKLLSSGFGFKYAHIEAALDAILGANTIRNRPEPDGGF